VGIGVGVKGVVLVVAGRGVGLRTTNNLTNNKQRKPAQRLAQHVAVSWLNGG
jgi:predicted NBD/HSP70 family sugar kinase